MDLGGTAIKLGGALSQNPMGLVATLLALALGCAVALASSVMAHPEHQQATQQGNPAAQHEHDHDHSHDQAPR
mgnify:CR=1 FL=1